MSQDWKEWGKKTGQEAGAEFAKKAAGEIGRRVGKIGEGSGDHQPLSGQPGTAEYDRGWNCAGIAAGTAVATVAALGLAGYLVGKNAVQNIKLDLGGNNGFDTLDAVRRNLEYCYRNGFAYTVQQHLKLYRRQDIDEIAARRKFGENPEGYRKLAAWLAPEGQQDNPQARLPALLDSWSNAGNSVAVRFIEKNQLPLDNLLVGACFPTQTDGHRVNREDEYDPLSVDSDVLWARVGAAPTLAMGGQALRLAQDAAEYVERNPVEPRRRLIVSGLAGLRELSRLALNGPEQAIDSAETMANAVAALKLDNPASPHE